jgi:NAD(P)-dependent dehydrogenase (short-subunit alcohol dehydrogenase family)
MIESHEFGAGTPAGASSRKREGEVMKRLEGKVSIVTGAAKGIGNAIAELFAQEGSTVVLADIDKSGEEAARRIEKNWGPAFYVEADVSNAEDVKKMVGAVMERCGKIDVLVNNAGISGGMDNGLDVEDDLWKKVIDINLNGVYLCTKFVGREMVKRESGSIVNMSSMLGVIGSPNSTAYHASKGAVRTYTKAMAIVLAPHHIRINSIHPGYIDTELVQKVFEDLGDPQARKDVENLHPLGRLGTPREVAHATLFLACDESSFITGTELMVDGGFTAQ